MDGRPSTEQAHAGRSDGEVGGIIGSWLLQMLLFLAIVAFVLYEAGSIVVTTMALDDTAREVARAARDEYRAEPSLDRATATAQEVASIRGAEVVSVAEDGDDLVVEVERRAPTLVVHRIGPLEDLAMVSTSARVSLAR